MPAIPSNLDEFKTIGVTISARLRSCLVLFSIGWLLVAACQSAVSDVGQEVSIDGGSYRVMSVQELQSMLEDKDFTMINVHIPWQGYIPQSD